MDEEIFRQGQRKGKRLVQDGEGKAGALKIAPKR